MNDPSLQSGFIQLYQQTIKMSILSQSISFEDDIMLRIFRNTSQYKLELTSQNNISFLYQLIMSQQQMSQHISTHKQEMQWFRYIFSGERIYHLTVKSEQAELLVEEREKYKNYQLGSFCFQLADDSMIKESLMYRYERMQIKEKMLDSYWENMCTVVKAKNPSLLLKMDQKYKKTIFK